MKPKVSICTSCTGGAELLGAVRAALPDRNVVGVDCMNVCTRPACVSVRQKGKHAYLFGDVSAEMAQNLVTLVALYEEAETGFIEDARPLGALRHCLIGRVPA